METRDIMNMGVIGALMMASDNHPRRRRRAVDINPLTGKQPLALPTSNRKAALLDKALRRQQRPSKTEGPSDGR